MSMHGRRQTCISKTNRHCMVAVACHMHYMQAFIIDIYISIYMDERERHAHGHWRSKTAHRACIPAMAAMDPVDGLQVLPKATARPSASAEPADAGAAPEPEVSSYVQSCIKANADLHRELMEMPAKPWFWYGGTLVLDLVEYVEATWTDAEMLGLGLGALIFTSLGAFI